MAAADQGQVHVEESFAGDARTEGRIGACRHAVLGRGGLTHVAHYTNGFVDFTVSDSTVSDLAGSGGRAALDRVGRSVVNRFTTLDDDVAALSSGPLIRLVLHCAQRVVFCNAVAADQRIASFTGVLAPHEGVTLTLEVMSADRVAAGLADELRDLFRLRSQNPGGWLTETDPVPPPGVSTGGTPSGSAAPARQGPAGPARDVLSGAVRPETLHSVAYYRHGAWWCSADVLDDPRVAPFLSPSVTPDYRRLSHRRLGDLLCQPPARIAQLGGDVEDTTGEIRRMVLDVEQGAVYCYRLGSDNFLLGVTMNQERVSQADREMAELATLFEPEMK